MAHFYGGVSGCRGPATRLGTKKSGLETFASGWEVGVKVYLTHNEQTDQDEAHIYLTSGSSPKGRSKLLGIYTQQHVEGWIS